MEAVCPFCAAPLPGDSGELPLARSVVARGVRRSTLFAMGVSLAASACEADNSIPIYGAPASPVAGAGGGAGRGNTGGTGGNAGVGGTAGAPGNAGGTGGAVGANDVDASAPRDAGDEDAGNPAP
jgi:hypothetical protein